MLTYLLIAFTAGVLPGVVLTIGDKVHEHRRASRGNPYPGTGYGSYPAQFPIPGSPASGARPRVVEEPIRAWKWARLGVASYATHHQMTSSGGLVRVDTRPTSSEPAFVGIGVGESTPYGVEAVAACATSSTHAHQAPHAECSCGFYAATNTTRAPGAWPGWVDGLILLEVELYGRVVVHEAGYRAERQRVLSATIKGPYDLNLLRAALPTEWRRA